MPHGSAGTVVVKSLHGAAISMFQGTGNHVGLRRPQALVGYDPLQAWMPLAARAIMTMSMNRMGADMHDNRQTSRAAAGSLLALGMMMAVALPARGRNTRRRQSG
jgi:hypothetical protein